MISETDLAYIAGIIDGEGCIRVVKTHDARNKTGTAYQTRLVVGMQDEAPLRFCKERSRTGCFYESKKDNKRYFNWELSAHQCKKLIPLLLPYLICKRGQAHKLLELYDYMHDPTRKQPRNSLGQLQTSPDSYVQHLEEVYNELRKMKQRSVVCTGGSV